MNLLRSKESDPHFELLTDAKLQKLQEGYNTEKARAN